jgi:hypothetical protein
VDYYAESGGGEGGRQGGSLNQNEQLAKGLRAMLLSCCGMLSLL